MDEIVKHIPHRNRLANSYPDQRIGTGINLYSAEGVSRVYTGKIIDSQGERMIPSLVQGSINDLKLSDPYPSKVHLFGEVNYQPEYYKGFEKFITFQLPSGGAVVIVDDHQHALFAMAESVVRGTTIPHATMLHIDFHDDMMEPFKLPKFTANDLNAKNLHDVMRYIVKELSEGDFIVPAYASGLIDTMIHIDPMQSSRKTLTSESYSVKHTVQFTQIGMDHSINRWLRLPKNERILDIDIDYFAASDRLLSRRIKEDKLRYKTIARNDMEKIQKMLPEAGLVTVALSAPHMNADIGLELIKEIFKN